METNVVTNEVEKSQAKQETKKEKPQAKQETKKEATSGKVPVTDKHRALIGELFLINEKMGTIKKLSSFNATILFENAVNTHGKKNVRLFEATDKNIEELAFILTKYENNILG